MESSVLDATCSNHKDEKMDACISKIHTQIPVEKWKPLGMQLGFSDTQLKNIRYDTAQEGIEETIFQLLVKWRDRLGSGATMEKLAAALQEVGLTNVAEQILPQLPWCSESAGVIGLDTTGLNPEQREYATQMQDRLRAEYQDLHLPGVPWEHLFLPIEELYVDLIITERDEYRRGNRTEDIHLEEIFLPMKAQSQKHPTKNVDKKRYLVVGGPGFGKTSTLKKIAYDWAVGKEYTSQYQLVVFLQLRHIDNNLKELIEEEAELSNPPIKLFPLLDKMGKTALLLLDGYDELSKKQVKDLDDLLRGKLFPKMTVVVSSRTVPNPTKQETIFWNRLIEIKGFTEERAKEFLAKYLENPQHLWEKLDTVLAHKKAQLMSCPLFLLLLGRMVEQEQLKDITNRTELFKAALNFMVRRSLIKKQIISSEEPFDMFKNQRSSPVTSTLWTSSKLFSLLLTFGEFSWKCLKTKTLCFERSEVLQHCKDEIVFEMGILMESDKESRNRELKHFYEAVHKTFMEFATALYLAQKMQTNQEFKDELEKQLKDLNKDVVVNLLSCLLFLDEMTERNVSVLRRLAEYYRAFDFYEDVLKHVTAVDEAESIEICGEFADFMTPRAHISDCDNLFGLSRLKLKQIKMFYCYSDSELPIERIDVETLYITMEEDDKIKTSLLKMNCKRIMFDFYRIDDKTDVTQLLKSFSEIMNHLRNRSKSEKPFPEIKLEMDGALIPYIEQVPSLKNITVHSIELLDVDQMSLPQITNLVNTFDITSELIIYFPVVPDIVFLKELAAKLNCKTRFSISFFSSTSIKAVTMLNSENNRLVEQLTISLEEIHQFDFLLYPRLTSLNITKLINGPFDLCSLFQVINKKVPRINHIIVVNRKFIGNAEGLVLSFPEQHNEFKNTECPERDSRTIVEEVTLMHFGLRPELHSFLFEQFKTLLSNKQILRLYVLEKLITKYDLQRYFPSLEFEIDCVYRLVFARYYLQNSGDYYQYEIKNRSAV